NRLPAVYPLREYVDAGGLIAYGPNLADSYRRASAYVDKILKGAKPGDLPVEQPTKFELVINVKIAKALSLEVPPSLLVRAAEVIEKPSPTPIHRCSLVRRMSQELAPLRKSRLGWHKRRGERPPRRHR